MFVYVLIALSRLSLSLSLSVPKISYSNFLDETKIIDIINDIISYKPIAVLKIKIIENSIIQQVSFGTVLLSNTSRQTVAEENDLLPKEAIQNKFEFGLKMGWDTWNCEPM